MDRNVREAAPPTQQGVALRKESVDRNLLRSAPSPAFPVVALRKESVDRNPYNFDSFCQYIVALRKESVDRNFRLFLFPAWLCCRSPQGERG